MPVASAYISMLALDAGKIINAHSIQRGGLLARIAYEGHVYCLSKNFSAVVKNHGRSTYERIGINRASTFLGFCRVHDNELFRPIDTVPLVPTEEQAFLYAYRSLCREYFVKESAYNLLSKQLEDMSQPEAFIELLSGMKNGTALGLRDLHFQKQQFDKSLSSKRYHDIRFVLFATKQDPTIAFSGITFPDFDFDGKPLQRIGRPSEQLQLLTYCSAPMEKGWGFLFAWHKRSTRICRLLMKSLNHRESPAQLADALFRLVFSCENHAIAPSWWQNVPVQSKKDILDRISDATDSLTDTPSNFLSEGLEGITNWRFSRAESNYDQISFRRR